MSRGIAPQPRAGRGDSRILRIIQQTRRILAAGLLAGLFCFPLITAVGVERFPPPEFDSGYVMPPTTTPPARSLYLEYLDVAVLLAALSASAYLVLWKRSRKWIFGLTLFSLVYFGFYRKGCVCAIGAIQDVVLSVFDTGYAVPLTVIAFFLLPLVFTLFFGRAFCAAVCPLGAIQDVVLVRPVKVKLWLEHALGLLPFFYLGAALLFAATGSAFIICQYDPFVSFFRRSGSLGMLGLGAVFLLVGMYIGRPYCRFLCPYGAVLRVLSKFSRWNVTLTPEDCVHCQLCDVACPFGAIREPADISPVELPPVSRTKLAALIILAPLLAGLGAWLGYALSTPFSGMHPTVSLAEQIAIEESGAVTNTTEASVAFRQTGRPIQELYNEARLTRKGFVLGSMLFGGFVGLVIGIKLLSVSLAPKQVAYEPDWGTCIACGRCYTHCPNELIRIKRQKRKNVIPLTPA